MTWIVGYKSLKLASKRYNTNAPIKTDKFYRSEHRLHVLSFPWEELHGMNIFLMHILQDLEHVEDRK